MTNGANNSRFEAFADRPPTLEGGIDLEVDVTDPRHVRLRLRQNGNRADLRAAYLSVPYPSGLRRLLAQEPDLDVVIVERLPIGLTQAAENAGVGVLDVRGKGRLVAPGFVYVVPPAPAYLAAGRNSRTSPFAPKASRIVRGLLTAPEERWRVSNLADAVGVDVGNAHRILASLVEMGVVERDEEAYLVSDPGSLLEAWAEFYRRPRERIALPIADDLGQDLRKLVVALDGDAVVSGEFAAELQAPYLPAAGALLHCYNLAAWESLRSSEQHDYAPTFMPRGRILVDMADDGVGQFASIVDGLPIAHPIQVYVDLFRDPGRGREAAEHLRRELIPY
jgi:hypothetical protein